MTPFAFIAVEKAPKEKFPEKENYICGYGLADLFDWFLEPHEWEAPLIDTETIKKVYKMLSESLKTEETREELLHEMQMYDSSVEIDDLFAVKRFLQVCAKNQYCLCIVEEVS